MRAIAIVVVACACHGHAAAPPDAPSCGAARLISCAPSGLVGQAFDGTTPWTFQGTIQRYGSPTATAYSFTTTITRDGTGCGHFAMNGYASSGWQVDDTAATFGSQVGNTTTIVDVCVDATGALHYHELDDMYLDSPNLQTLDGTLSHP